jgi:RNA polymerase sigma-70 factor (ECF subfamily)
MSGAAARAANVLSLPVRREPARHWRHEQDGTSEDEARGVVPEEPADLPAAADLVDDLDDDPALATLAEDTPGSAERRSGPAPAAEHADDTTLGAWIARIARQDERALEALYDATAARVNGIVLRILQRAALAEEVLEDTYWQVWRQAPRFDAERGRPITWLLAIARSRAIDALRREQRFLHDALPEDDEADAAGLSDARALPPQDLLEAARGQAHVHAALASLEPCSRQLVSLAFFRGLTHEEIAEQQGLPLGTVKSLIRRALQQLRRVMEAEHA